MRHFTTARVVFFFWLAIQIDGPAAAQNTDPRLAPSSPTAQVGAQPATPTGQSPAISAPTAATSAPTTAATSAGAQPLAKEKETSKETSVSKSEIKEIKDHPSDWVGVTDAIAWPLALLIAAFLLRRLLSRVVAFLPRTVRNLKISVAGMEMEIDSEAADEVKQFLQRPIEQLKRNADAEYRKFSEALRVYELLQSVIETGCTRVLESKDISRPALIRGTVYVPDIVFSDHLYQLVNYYPGSRSNGPAGRRFSQRFGIIGRSWRLGESMARPSAPGASADDIRDLMEQWGMTREEASAQSRVHQACLCVILRSPEDNNLPVGLLYLDTTQDRGFGADIALAVQVAKELEVDNTVIQLATGVGRAIMPLRVAGPRLKISE